MKTRSITLTAKQRRAADALRGIRPTCLPSTNVIVESDETRKHWFNLVCSVMEWNHVTRSPIILIKEFCDRAGVPDILIKEFCDRAGVPD